MTIRNVITTCGSLGVFLMAAPAALASNMIMGSVVTMDENGKISSSFSQPMELGVVSSGNLKNQNLGTPQNLLGFTINVTFPGPNPPTASQQAIFTTAANNWQSRITGYRGVMTVPSVNITADAPAIDGPGMILGSAGPTFASDQDEDGVAGGARFFVTTAGAMNFDSADIAVLEGNGTLLQVIEHEMAHVLGFGTLWDGPSAGGSATTQVVLPAGTFNYTGPSALNQYQTEFGQGAAAFIPIEQGGGPGTAGGHWDEVDGGGAPTGIVSTAGDLQNELMGGWLDSPTFVSQMTIEQFADIGYTVVPEPATGFLAILGLASLVIRRRR